jgi:hypothetical protein
MQPFSGAHGTTPRSRGFFGLITWNFSFGFLRVFGSIQQKPVGLSNRWLLSCQAADFESRGSSASRAFTLI